VKNQPNYQDFSHSFLYECFISKTTTEFSTISAAFCMDILFQQPQQNSQLFRRFYLWIFDIQKSFKTATFFDVFFDRNSNLETIQIREKQSARLFQQKNHAIAFSMQKLRATASF